MLIMGVFNVFARASRAGRTREEKGLTGCARARMGVLWHQGLFPQGIGHSRQLLTIHYCFQVAGIDQILADLTDRFVS